MAGHRGLREEGIRQKIQPHMARNCWPQLRLLCHARDQAFHLLLLRPSSYPALQVWLRGVWQLIKWGTVVGWTGGCSWSSSPGVVVCKAGSSVRVRCQTDNSQRDTATHCANRM